MRFGAGSHGPAPRQGFCGWFGGVGAELVDVVSVSPGLSQWQQPFSFPMAHKMPFSSISPPGEETSPEEAVPPARASTGQGNVAFRPPH